MSIIIDALGEATGSDVAIESSIMRKKNSENRCSFIDTCLILTYVREIRMI